jgi:predicted PurR-regulated permease PerM
MMARHVPAALLLAPHRPACRLRSGARFIASVVAAAALALTVSPRMAIVTLVLSGSSHTIENYLIAPWAYGRRVRLSDLAIVLAFVAGAELAGVIGVLVAWPIAAP